MVTINLLPWREELRQHQFKIMKLMLLLTMICNMSVTGWLHFHFIHKSDAIWQQVTQLESAVQTLSSTSVNNINANSLTTELLTALTNHRGATKKLFLAISKKPPIDICFTNISRKADTLLISGHASSSISLTDFLLNWPATELFSEMTITQLEQIKSGVQFQFAAVEKQLFPSGLLIGK